MISPFLSGNITYLCLRLIYALSMSNFVNARLSLDTFSRFDSRKWNFRKLVFEYVRK